MHTHTHTQTHDIDTATSARHDHWQGHSLRAGSARPRRPPRRRTHADSIKSATSPRHRRWRHRAHRPVAAALAVLAAIITPALRRRSHDR
jgi:hypothetical protein